MPGKKVNLIIKKEGLSLLETHSIRETTRILNTRYSMDLEPSTVLRWKQQKAKILKNVTTSKATEKKLKKTFHLADQCQLDFETELFTRCMDAYGRGVRLYSRIIKNKARDLQKEDSYSNFRCEFGRKWFDSFIKVGFHKLYQSTLNLNQSFSLKPIKEIRT